MSKLKLSVPSIYKNKKSEQIPSKHDSKIKSTANVDLSHKATIKNKHHLQRKWLIQKKITWRYIHKLDHESKLNAQLRDQNKHNTDKLNKTIKSLKNQASLKNDVVNSLEDDLKSQKSKTNGYAQKVELAVLTFNRIHELTKDQSNLRGLISDYQTRFNDCYLRCRNKGDQIKVSIRYYHMLERKSQEAFGKLDKIEFNLNNQARQIQHRQRDYNKNSQYLLHFKMVKRFGKRYKRALRVHHKSCLKLNDMITRYNQQLRIFKQRRQQIFAKYLNRHIAHNYHAYCRQYDKLMDNSHSKIKSWQMILVNIRKRLISIDKALKHEINNPVWAVHITK